MSETSGHAQSRYRLTSRSINPVIYRYRHPISFKLRFAHAIQTHILMPIQMPQQGQLSQTPPRQDDLVKHPRQELDGDLFPRDRVFGRDDQSVSSLP
jgi:hypothetical protein